MFELPDEGFRFAEDFEKWQRDNIWEDKKKSDQWVNVLAYVTENVAKLPINYKINVEQYVALNFTGGYEHNQPGILHSRADEKYLRGKKLSLLHDKYVGVINPKTGKLFTATDIADIYETLPSDMSIRQVDRWMKRYGVGTGSAVRKILSKYRNRLLK